MKCPAFGAGRKSFLFEVWKMTGLFASLRPLDSLQRLRALLLAPEAPVGPVAGPNRADPDLMGRVGEEKRR